MGIVYDVVKPVVPCVCMLGDNTVYVTSHTIQEKSDTVLGRRWQLRRQREVLYTTDTSHEPFKRHLSHVWYFQLVEVDTIDPSWETAR